MLNIIGVLISMALINLCIIQDGFAVAKKMLREYDEMKEEIKNLKTSTFYQKFLSIYKTILFFCLKCRKST